MTKKEWQNKFNITDEEMDFLSYLVDNGCIITNIRNEHLNMTLDVMFNLK